MIVTSYFFLHHIGHWVHQVTVEIALPTVFKKGPYLQLRCTHMYPGDKHHT